MTTIHTAQDVADFLNARDRTVATPIRVKIGRTTYVGARYSQTRDHAPGSPAHREGARTYVQSGYYLLGQLPPSYVWRNAGYYVDQYHRSFYLAGYYPPDQSSDEVNEWHPFGPMFQLFPDEQGVATGRPMRMRVG